MHAEPRFELVVLDQVLRERGCSSETSKLDGVSRAWVRRDAGGGISAVAEYKPSDATLTVPADHVWTIAYSLRLEPEEILDEIKKRGGEFLG